MSETVWLRATGMARGGHFEPLHPARVKAILDGLEAQRIEVAYRREVRRRTLPQNAKIHVLAAAIADYTGESMLRTKRLATLGALGLEDGLVDPTLIDRRRRLRFKDVRPTACLSRREGSRVIETLLEQLDFLEIPQPRDEDHEVMA